MIKVKIHINGTEYEVEPGKNLLHTCLALGFDIPYFCFHPALGSVGACRQCAVKKFSGTDDKTGKIVMSCMEPVSMGLIISTDDPEIKVFRAAVIESLMQNHPHDCPVCDEGGECHLQDMTVMTGHNYRRFAFRKRTHNNQDLGPYIHHEMNRCIQCYRCVRFYKEYAGGTDLNVFGSSDRVYFGRQKEGALESEFSGNLIEVCPTGVFTDKTLREHYTRKWDLTSSPSVCTQCSVGCNILVGERYGHVRRILSRYNGAVNGYFLCDRGRFGYEFINHPERTRKVMARVRDKEFPEEIPDEDRWSVILSAVKGKKLAGIGSPVASLESNFALEKLVGKENFYHGIPDKTFTLIKTAVQILKEGPAHSPSLKEIEKSDALLILGEDPMESAPMLALSIRQASRNRSFEIAAGSGVPIWNDAVVRELAQKIKSPVFIAASDKTRLDDLAEEIYNASADEIAGLGFEIASLIDEAAPKPKDSGKSPGGTAKKIADTLKNADNPVIITGLHYNNVKILYAAANISRALVRMGKKASLSIIFPECNSLGLGLMDGKPLEELIEPAGMRDVETLIILENDLYKRFDKERIDNLLNNCENVIVLDYLMNDTAKKAGILLPAGTFAESTGTIVSNEGRAQRYYRVLPANGQIMDSWRYISGIIDLTGKKNSSKWKYFDNLVASMTDAYPSLGRIREILPDSGFRIFNGKIARQTPRFSGRTAINADVSVSEPGPPEDEDSPLNFSMEGFKGVPPSSLVPWYWSSGWNSVQAMNKYMDEPAGTPAGGNPGVLLFDNKNGRMAEYYKTE